MATEYDQISLEVRKAQKSIIVNMTAFAAAVLITVLTYLSPSPVFLIAWGAMIFCPISALKSYRKYSKLSTVLKSRLQR